ncbi:MAG TPA: penicillin-binding protein activator [Casimicrobiaceae bacterium]|nr:penicillin-binding protein activator [Casimicrobiaceae bacterium]
MPQSPGAAAVEPMPAGGVAAQSHTIALVLPLASPLYGRAAEAVKAGFLAAANASGDAHRVQVIGHGDDGVLPAFATAAESGAALVVGPLTRDDLKTVLTLAPVRPRMLALNQPDDGSALPPEAYALGLSVESDATLLVRQAIADGVRTVASVTGDSPFQQRFRSAFASAWQRSGGAPMRDYRFDPNPDVLAVLRRELGARPPDATLLCVSPGDAALAKSFLPPGPVYASSQVTDGVPPEMLRDLEGVRYVEIPWLAEPDDPALARLPRAPMGDPVLDRLYALGLDAFVIAELLASPTPPARIELDGATGHLTLTASRVFARQGRLMVIRGGVPTPYSRP